VNNISHLQTARDVFIHLQQDLPFFASSKASFRSRWGHFNVRVEIVQRTVHQVFLLDEDQVECAQTLPKGRVITPLFDCPLATIAKTRYRLHLEFKSDFENSAVKLELVRMTVQSNIKAPQLPPVLTLLNKQQYTFFKKGTSPHSENQEPVGYLDCVDGSVGFFL
jgi:hypothetical protein